MKRPPWNAPDSVKHVYVLTNLLNDWRRIAGQDGYTVSFTDNEGHLDAHVERKEERAA